MTDKVFDLMKCFPNSSIRSCGEVILTERGNVSFTVKGIEDDETLKYKLLEWCSRDAAKGCPYSTERNNRLWRRSLILGFNQFLRTNFDESDMWIIYDRLGNAINHELTVKFVESGYDMNLLKERQ